MKLAPQLLLPSVALVLVVVTIGTAVSASEVPLRRGPPPPSQAKDVDEAIQITSMTTEYLTNPLGVDVKNPRFTWKLVKSNNDNNNSKKKRGIYQTKYQIQVSALDYESNATTDWICDSVPSQQSYLVPLLLLNGGATISTGEETPCQGLELKSDTHYEWRVTVTYRQTATQEGQEEEKEVTSPKAYFRTGLLLDPSLDWKDASWITGGNEHTLLRSPPFATGTTTKIRSHATLFISGVGYYEAYLNGQRIGDHQLDVGWTDYRKRVWYSTHDVTNLLVLGEGKSDNVLTVWLGNGWWSCGVPPGTNQPMCNPNDPPQLKLQLRVDGQIVLTSSSGTGWRATKSPILYNSLYNGETYDGRMEDKFQKWLLPATDDDDDDDDKDWIPVQEANSVVNNATMSSQLFEPIRHISTRPPLSISIIGTTTTTTITPTLIQVIDFGQNQAGVVRLKNIHCPYRGANITIRHSEALMHPPYGDRNGSLYVANLRTAKATDVYICKGSAIEGGESYTPRFTQHGFRYVEITGLTYPLQEDNVEAIEMHTDVEQTSSLVFSNRLLNEIQHACVWGQKSNLMSLPTDCPQRDERRGWMGDASLTAELAVYNFGMGALYSRWLYQILDAQSVDGSVPDFVPALDHLGKPGSPNWQSAFPNILFVLYRYYGDRHVLSQYHDALVRYYDYLEDQYKQTGMAQFRQKFGDWCPPDPHPRANGHLLGAFALVNDLRLGVEMFQGSSHPQAPDQAKRCQDLVQKLVGEFHVAFFNQTTQQYGSGLQTEQALALFLGTAPSDLQKKVLDDLVHDILVTQGGHTTSGIVGIKYGMEVLSLLGQNQAALTLALQTSYPSWGYMIHNEDEPATTVWELWNGDAAGPGMNSRNHIMFGTISGWLYKYLAGIQPSQAGFAHISIKPKGQEHLNQASAKVVTPFGDIISSWFKTTSDEGATWSYHHSLSLPIGTNTTLLIPFPAGKVGDFKIVEGDDSVVVWQNAKFTTGLPGIVSGTQLPEGIQLELLNGDFDFVASAKIATSSVLF